MLLAQFVTRTAVTFAITLHGFTEPVLKLLYRVLAWSAFSHFLPCLLYQFLPKPQFVVGIERHRLYHLPQALLLIEMVAFIFLMLFTMQI